MSQMHVCDVDATTSIGSIDIALQPISGLHQQTSTQQRNDTQQPPITNYHRRPQRSPTPRPQRRGRSPTQRPRRPLTTTTTNNHQRPTTTTTTTNDQRPPTITNDQQPPTTINSSNSSSSYVENSSTRARRQRVAPSNCDVALLGLRPACVSEIRVIPTHTLRGEGLQQVRIGDPLCSQGRPQGIRLQTGKFGTSAPSPTGNSGRL